MAFGLVSVENKRFQSVHEIKFALNYRQPKPLRGIGIWGCCRSSVIKDELQKSLRRAKNYSSFVRTDIETSVGNAKPNSCYVRKALSLRTLGI